MAEDDEIDILGDEGLESFIPEKEALFSNNTSGTLDDSILVSDCDTLLEFEYTVHPQWLSDKPSTNPTCWYDNLNGILEPPAPSKSTSVTEQHSIDGSVWTEMEKILLNRAIEIFGKSPTNLAQFIGSKTETEVKRYLRHCYAATENFKENIILDDLSMQDDVYTVDNIDSRVLLEDIEIPASMEEEVVSTVSLTTPSKRTKTSNKPKQKHTNTTISFKDIPSGQSLLKKYHMEPLKKSRPLHKHKTGTVKKTKTPKKNPKVKFKIKGAVLKNYNNNMRRSKKTSETLSSTESETSNGGRDNSGGRETPAQVVRQVITTGKGLSVPFCEGEKIIRIKKESDLEDSDTEIDIEDSSDEQPSTSNNSASPVKSTNYEVNTEPESETDLKIANTIVQTISRREPDMSQLTEDEVNTLTGMGFPEAEYVIDDSKICNLEKVINFDFFDGVGANTPERYMKIRTHILNAWRKIKPSYVTKTSIRPGLKNCGDVKYISKVHTFLEQIGAINFNCGISYIRPLYDLINVPTTSPKQKKVVESNVIVPRNKHDRHRHKHKIINLNDGQGGYTTQHDEEGEVMNTTIVNEDRKKRTVKKHVPLITCRPFPAENPQQYKVRIDLSTLLIMDLHAHASLSEVMGLIAGHWDESQQLLTINKYEPCKNIASSTMHCEMCPVSQSIAAGNIHAKSLQILGWFHSHPTGAPEPSQQDIDTQLSVQRYIRNNNPCVGVIMSPFSAHGALIASPLRCMVVGRNFNDDVVPYKLSVAVDDTNLIVEDLVSSAKGVFYSNYVDKVTRRVNFSKPYFQNDSITYLDKFISSVKMHLAKCSNINKMTCDEIVEKLSIVCTVRT